MAERDDGFGPAMRGGVGYEDPAPPGGEPDDRGYGPAARGRHRGRLGRRFGKVLVVTLLVLVLIVALTGVALAAYTTIRMDRQPVSGLSSAAGQMNVLLVGSDSREDLTDEERAELRTGSAEGVRTDTILLLSVAGDRAAMLSFPRDLYVSRCDGTQGRINTAYALDGPSCLVQTVTGLSGIPVTHYVEVDFRGFVGIVDAVGGVTLHIDEPITDPRAGLDLEAGCQRLDGAQALGFVRTRAADDDLGRVARQQRFIRELADEVVQPSTLVNVPRLFSVADASARAVTTDSGLGLLDLGRLARAAQGLRGDGLPSHVVPASPATVGEAAVLVPIESEADPLFARFRDGSILRDAGAETVDLAPGDVAVAVYNGAGTPGLAAEGAEHLEDRGFEVTDVGNTDPVERTVVRYREGNEAAARLVADELGAAATEQVADGPPVAVVLGPDVDLSGDGAGEAPEAVPAPDDDADEPPASDPGDAASPDVPEDVLGAGPADC